MPEHEPSSCYTAFEELRDLARGLHPAVLTAHGLDVALESLAVRATLPVALEVDLSRRPAAEVEVEALTNIAKYARADGARVTVTRAGGAADRRGRGRRRRRRDPSRGSGLRGLADRVGAFGGRLAISDAYGGGTVVRAQIPLRA